MPLIAKKTLFQSAWVILRTMKRLIIALVLVAGFCCAGFAEENNSANVDYRITSGGFWVWEDNLSGGFGEFGVNLLPKENHFVLRNCFFIQGEGSSVDMSQGSGNSIEVGGLEIGDKILIGGRYNCPGFIIRSYGYIGGSFGFMSWDDHPFGSRPFMISAKFGGGFEFQYVRGCAFVAEFGGVQRFLVGGGKSNISNFPNHAPCLTIGFRTFR